MFKRTSSLLFLLSIFFAIVTSTRVQPLTPVAFAHYTPLPSGTQVLSSWQFRQEIDKRLNGTVPVEPKIHGKVDILGEERDGSDVVNHVNVNLQRNVADFSGSDLGAQISNALASFPARTCGEVIIPAGDYTLTTTVNLPITGTSPMAAEQAATNCWIHGQSRTNTRINAPITNTCAFSQLLTNPEQVIDTGARFSDFSINGSSVPDTNGTSKAGAKAFCYGGTTQETFERLNIDNFSGPGAAGIYVDIPEHMWTERSYTDDVLLSNNTYGMWFRGHPSKDGLGVSALHNTLNLWLNVEASSQIGIYITESAQIGRSRIYLNGNIDPTGGIAIKTDATGTVEHSYIESYVENTSAGGATLLDCTANPGRCIVTGSYESQGGLMQIRGVINGQMFATDQSTLESFNSNTANGPAPFVDSLHLSILGAAVYGFRPNNLPSNACQSGQAHFRMCAVNATGCTSGTTLAIGGSTPCEVWCDGKHWMESGSGC